MEELGPRDDARAGQPDRLSARFTDEFESDVAGRVAERLRRLDRRQMRGLVEDLRLVLLDAVAASDAPTADVATVRSSAEPVGGRPRQSSGPPAPAEGAGSTAAAIGTIERLVPRVRSSTPRRVGVVLASGFLATIAASLLFVPGADPPRAPAEDAPPPEVIELAPPDETQPAPETAPSAAQAPAVTIDAPTPLPPAASNPRSSATPAATPLVTATANGGKVIQSTPTTRPVPRGSKKPTAVAAPSPPKGDASGEPKPDAYKPMPPPNDAKTAVDVSPTGAPAMDPTRARDTNPSPLTAGMSAPRPAAGDTKGDSARSAGAASPVEPAPTASPEFAAAPEPRSAPSTPPSPEQHAPSVPSPAKAGGLPNAPTTLPPAVVQALLERGDHFLSLGDIASARMFYERAAEAGSAAAATGVALTFDPQFLKQMGTVGIRGDKANAIAWYRRASEAGDQSAAERLNSLRADGAR